MVTIIHKVIITKIKSDITVTTAATPKMHFTARGKTKKSIHLINNSSESDDDHINIKTLEMNININSMSKSDDVIKITPLVNSLSLEMELDTAAAVSVIPEKIFMEKLPSVKMKPSDIVLKTYTCLLVLQMLT